MPDGDLDEGVKQDYGRLNFRGVTMAYLVLGDHKRFTLTDVVCNLYPLTPRTTVISRMDKMKIVRTPCTPEQIRKLKAARGVHSSSVVCSLVSKPAIDDFCDKYPIDVRANPDCRVNADKEKNDKNLCKVMNKTAKKPNSSPDICNDKLVSTKKRRSKNMNSASDLSRETKRVNTAAMNGEESVHIFDADGPLFHPLPSDSCKGDMTISSENLASKSFLAANHVTTTAKSTKKRPFPPNQTTSKLSKIKKEYSPTKRKKLSDSNEANALVRKVKKAKLKQSNSEEQLVINEDSPSAVNKLNSQWWLFDHLSETSSLSSLSSSPKTNESSFTSLGSNIHEHPPTSVKKELFSTPKKNTINSKAGKTNNRNISLNASPPSLILKRQGKRTWHVEQSTIDNPVKKILKLAPLSKNKDSIILPKKRVSKKLCAETITVSSTVNIKQEKDDGSVHQSRKAVVNVRKTKCLTKNSDGTKAGIKKKKVKRKNPKCSADELNLVDCTGDQNTTYCRQKVQLNLNLKQVLPLKKKREKRNKIVEHDSLLHNNKITKSIGRGKVSKLKKIKTEPLSEGEFDFNTLQKHNDVLFHQFPTPEPTPSATPTTTKPAKVVVKLTPVKTKLKANAKFKFMDMFPAEPSLVLQKGHLVPPYSMFFSQGQKPPSSHPLATWRIGGRVVGLNNTRYKVRGTKLV